MYRLSRYWNRAVYLLVDLARFLVWDYTGMNGDLLDNDFSTEYTKEILTYIPRPPKTHPIDL